MLVQSQSYTRPTQDQARLAAAALRHLRAAMQADDPATARQALGQARFRAALLKEAVERAAFNEPARKLATEINQALDYAAPGSPWLSLACDRLGRLSRRGTI